MDRSETCFLKLYGTFRLEGPDGARIDIRSKRGQALVAMLALSPDGERSRAWLQQALWTDRAPEQAGASLRRELSTLRRLVNRKGLELLTADSQRVRLDMDALEVDVLAGQRPPNVELLEGLDIVSAEGFDDWLRTERQAAPRTEQDRGAAGGSRSEGRSAGPARSDESLRVAVLRFGTSGDAGLDGAADDIASDLIDMLGRNSWLEVVARSGSFGFRSGETDPREAGGELDARYIVEGRLTGDGKRASLRLELTDAETAASLRTERYTLDDPGAALNDRSLFAEMAAMLAIRVELAEQQRALRVTEGEESPEDLVWQARHHLARLSDGDNAAARTLLGRALDADPVYFEAQVQMLWLTIRDLWLNRGKPEDIRAARREAQLLIQRDVNDARPYTLAGIAELWLGHIARAESLLDKAIGLNPALAMAYAQQGGVLYFKGQFAKALSVLEQARKLSPSDQDLFFIHGQLAMAHLLGRQFEQAVEHAEEALALRAGYWFGHLINLVALAELGRQEGAEDALESLMRAKPGFSTRYIRWLPFDDEAHCDFLVQGLNRAGYDGD